MSARNQSLSPIDRASEIRSDAAALALLWHSAQIIPILGSHIGAKNGRIRFLDAENVELLLSTFESGERYFLGQSRDGGQAYFAWRTSWINEPSDEAVKFEGFRTLREDRYSRSPRLPAS